MSQALSHTGIKAAFLFFKNVTRSTLCKILVPSGILCMDTYFSNHQCVLGGDPQSTCRITSQRTRPFLDEIKPEDSSAPSLMPSSPWALSPQEPTEMYSKGLLITAPTLLYKSTTWFTLPANMCITPEKVMPSYSSAQSEPPFANKCMKRTVCKLDFVHMRIVPFLQINWCSYLRPIVYNQKCLIPLRLSQWKPVTFYMGNTCIMYSLHWLIFVMHEAYFGNI